MGKNKGRGRGRSHQKSKNKAKNKSNAQIEATKRLKKRKRGSYASLIVEPKASSNQVSEIADILFDGPYYCVGDYKQQQQG